MVKHFNNLQKMKLSITDASKPGYFGKPITFNNKDILNESINICYVLKNKTAYINNLVIYLR